MKAKSTFTVSKWNEAILNEDAHVAQISATFEAAGELCGSFDVHYLMYTSLQNPQNPASSYTGYLVFTGSIAGKAGSFTAQDSGTYSQNGPESRFMLMTGSSTGEFAGISLCGSYYQSGGEMVVDIEYNF